MKKLLNRFLMVLLAFVMVFTVACGGGNETSEPGESTGPTTPPTDQTDWTDLSVREATGANGVVASASAYAWTDAV